MNIYRNIRIYILYTLFHNRSLAFSNCGRKCNYLPIYIAFADGVIINQSKLPNSASSKSLCNISSNSSDSENGNMGFAKTVQSVFSQEHAGSCVDHESASENALENSEKNVLFAMDSLFRIRMSRKIVVASNPMTEKIIPVTESNFLF